MCEPSSTSTDLATFQRFVELCAGRTAQLLNYASLAGDCGISQPCAKAWLGILEACFIAFRLPAFENQDAQTAGEDAEALLPRHRACLLAAGYPRGAAASLAPAARRPVRDLGGFGNHQKSAPTRANTQALSFYRDRNGAEADLIIERPAGCMLLDAKSSATPSDSLFSGVRRVRRHFPDAPPHDVAVAYGGEEFQQRSGGRLIPWRMLRQAALANADSRDFASLPAAGRSPMPASWRCFRTTPGSARIPARTARRPSICIPAICP